MNEPHYKRCLLSEPARFFGAMVLLLNHFGACGEGVRDALDLYQTHVFIGIYCSGTDPAIHRVLSEGGFL